MARGGFLPQDPAGIAKNNVDAATSKNSGLGWQQLLVTRWGISSVD
jgi:hypothetical protein